jgi:hypothetical protein
MKKSTRSLIVIICLIILLGASGWGLTINWFKGFASRSEEVIRQGKMFGSSTTDTGCLSMVTEVEKTCSGLECRVMNGVYFQSCLEESEQTPAFCDGVPSNSDIPRSIAWRLVVCDQLGLSGNGCNDLLSVMQRHCDKSSLD